MNEYQHVIRNSLGEGNQREEEPETAPFFLGNVQTLAILSHDFARIALYHHL